MPCIFCQADERTQEKEIICSHCVQKLLALTPEKAKELHDKAVEKGFFDRAEVLKSLFAEEEHVPETRFTRSRMERTGFVCQAEFTPEGERQERAA